MGTGTFVSLVLAALVALAAGCEAQGRPEGFFEPCVTDEDCVGDWECLIYVAPPVDGGTERRVCSRRCSTTSECPPVHSDHCGELRMCAVDQGVCAIRGCR